MKICSFCELVSILAGNEPTELFEINFFSPNVTIKGIHCKKQGNFEFLSTDFQISLRQICKLLTPEPKKFFASLDVQCVASFVCTENFI